MIVIRDLRRKEKFQVDDEYLNGYAKLCGVYATAVYICLCRHADYHTQSCFPSIETMAEKLSVSRDSVIKGIHLLEKWGIIKKEKTRHPDNAKWINNSYVLLDKSVWVPKPSHVGNSDVDSHVGVSIKPRRSQPQSQVAVADGKDYTLEGDTLEGGNSEELRDKKTFQYSKEGALVIELFVKNLNGSCSRYYANTTQRKACDFLLKEHGFDRVKKLIEETLPKTNKIAYMPSITTPLQLVEKYADLEAKMYQLKNKKEINKPKVIFS